MAGAKVKDIDRYIIKGLADCSLNATETAKTLYMGRRTIYTHIDSIKKETGLNPLKFWDLIKLLKGDAK